MKITELIAAIEQSKRERGRYPTHALFTEIKHQLPEKSTDELKAELRKLAAADAITWGPTINDTYFRIKPL